MGERPEAQAMLRAAEPRAKLELYAQFVSGIHERIAAFTGPSRPIGAGLSTCSWPL